MPEAKEREGCSQQETHQVDDSLETLFLDERDKQVLVDALVSKQKPGHRIRQAASRCLGPKLWRSLAYHFFS